MSDSIDQSIAAWIESLPSEEDVRNGIIEECAKIADPWPGFYPLDLATSKDLAVIKARTEIAAKIRGLKAQFDPKDIIR